MTKRPRPWRAGPIVALAILAIGGCDSAAPVSPTTTTPGPATPPPSFAPFPAAATLPEVRAAIERIAEGRFNSIGDGAGVIVVGLRSTEQELARRIVEAYGPRVQVSVGLFPFPPPAGAPRSCGFPWRFANPGPLRATLEMDPPRVAPGAYFNLTVRITNQGLTRTTFESSSNFNVFLFRPGETEPVGASDGGSLGTGFQKDLEPMESITLPGYGGTASCDLALGYVLPPGPYEARALVDFTPAPQGGVAVFLSAPLPIEVAAP